MILQETVLVTLSPSNIQYFKSLGYEIPIYLDKKNRLLVKRNSQIEVQVSDLQLSFLNHKLGISYYSLTTHSSKTIRY